MCDLYIGMIYITICPKCLKLVEIRAIRRKGEIITLPRVKNCSRFRLEDKSLNFQVLSPQNGTAVPNGFKAVTYYRRLFFKNFPKFGYFRKLNQDTEAFFRDLRNLTTGGISGKLNFTY